MQTSIETRALQTPPAELDGWGDLETLARRIAPATVDPEDLAQDARIAAWQAGGQVHAPRSWLRGVLRHRAIDRHRAQARRQRRERDVGDVPPPEASSPEHAAELREQLGVLAEALERLEPIETRPEPMCAPRGTHGHAEPQRQRDRAVVDHHHGNRCGPGWRPTGARGAPGPRR